MLSAKRTQVPEGHVWLQGDNTLNSHDSRQFGPVPYALLKGRAIVRLRVRFPAFSAIGLHCRDTVVSAVMSCSAAATLSPFVALMLVRWRTRLS